MQPSHRSTITSVFASIVVSLASLVTIGTSPASAVSTVPKATGGVELGTTLQYMSFSAFDQTPAKGSVTYTNFDYSTPGSGVWSFTAGETMKLSFVIGGNTYVHSMMVTSRDALSPNTLAFGASGYYLPDTNYTWTANGLIQGTSFTMSLMYTGVGAGYSLVMNGTIASDGSIAGTESYGTTNDYGTWSAPAGSAFEAFSYTAPVTCASVTEATTNAPGTARFGYTIPTNAPALVGTPVVFSVVDGGTPGTSGDLVTYGYGSGVNPSTCTGTMSASQTVIGGNLVVH